MAKSKPKTDQVSTLKSWDDVDSQLKAIAILKTKIMAEESKMNEDKLKVQQKYQPTLDKYNAELIGYERDVELFCEKERDADYFAEKRSKELNYGVVGFRKGSGQLKPKQGFTWEAVKQIISKSKKFAEQFLRTKVDIDKTAILGANLKPAELDKLAVRIEVQDTFYYDAYLKKSVGTDGE